MICCALITRQQQVIDLADVQCSASVSNAFRDRERRVFYVVIRAAMSVLVVTSLPNRRDRKTLHRACDHARPTRTGVVQDLLLALTSRGPENVGFGELKLQPVGDHPRRHFVHGNTRSAGKVVSITSAVSSKDVSEDSW